MVDFLTGVAFWAVFRHLENSISPSFFNKIDFCSAENVGFRKCYRFCRSELCESMIWRSNRIFKLTSLQIVESTQVDPTIPQFWGNKNKSLIKRKKIRSCAECFTAHNFEVDLLLIHPPSNFIRIKNQNWNEINCNVLIDHFHRFCLFFKDLGDFKSFVIFETTCF